MPVLLVSVIVVTLTGVAMLGFMFTRGDSRLGISALAVLIAGQTLATVYAVIQE